MVQICFSVNRMHVEDHYYHDKFFIRATGRITEKLVFTGYWKILNKLVVYDKENNRFFFTDWGFFIFRNNFIPKIF